MGFLSLRGVAQPPETRLPNFMYEFYYIEVKLISKPAPTQIFKSFPILKFFFSPDFYHKFSLDNHLYVPMYMVLWATEYP